MNLDRPGWVSIKDDAGESLMPPRYMLLPEEAKHPSGPYKQAPDGHYWHVSPFNPAPWAERPSEQLPEGVIRLFGKRPAFEDFKHTPQPSRMWRAARVAWENDIRTFLGLASPTEAGISQSDFDTAASVYQTWGMGSPVLYRNIYGIRVRWPHSDLRDFEQGPGSLEYPHQTIARYQARLLAEGGEVDRRHWLLPFYVDEEASRA